MQLTNKTDDYVAFRVRTTNPRKCFAQPGTGVILPRTTCNVTVTVQAQKDAPPDLQCKDKYILQCVIAPDGTTAKDILPQEFNKELGKIVEEFELRVVYIPANPPSPAPEGSSPRASSLENGNKNATSFEDELMRREISKSHALGFSLVFVVLVGLLGVLIGYILQRS